MAGTRKVTQAQAEAVLKAVAAWMGPDTPTGKDAAHAGLGPMLVMDWDWPGEPTPTILLEGGPYDWALLAGDAQSGQPVMDRELYALAREAGAGEDRAAKVAERPALKLPKGVYVEAYAGYALCIYPESES